MWLVYFCFKEELICRLLLLLLLLLLVLTALHLLRQCHNQGRRCPKSHDGGVLLSSIGSKFTVHRLEGI